MTSVQVQAGLSSVTHVGLTLATLFGGFAASVYAVKAPSSQVFGRSVFKGSSNRRSIALTFDDGPSPGTLHLLDYFAQQGVRATFFQCGANVQRHPEIARAVQRAGHEIGNHTFSHPRLCPRLGWQLNVRSRQNVFDEFAQTQHVLHGLGIGPVLLRAPYGLRWFGMRQAQRQLGLLGVMWTVIGHDWEWEPEAVADLVLAKAAPGGIVCLHDGRDTRPNPNIDTTIAAVKRIVPALQRQGYTFETVSELLQPRPAQR